MVKPFWKTSEFYFTLATSIGAITLALKDVVPTKYAGLMVAVSTAAYAISRGLTKAGTSQ